MNTEMDNSFRGPGPIDVRIASTTYSVAPGGSTTVTVHLLNPGAAADVFQLSVHGIPADWVSFPSPVVHLQPGEQRHAVLIIRPPRFPQGQIGRYPIRIQVTSRDEPDRVTAVQATLTVAAYEVSGRVGLLMASTSFAVAPGASTTIPFVIVNQGIEADYVKLSVEGIPASWVSTPAAVTHLGPGEQKQVTLTILPPRTAQSRAGRHRFKILAMSQSALDQMVEVACILTVATFSEFKSVLHPPQVPAGQIARVVLENRGNVQQRYSVAFLSDVEELVFRPGPIQELRVPAGEMAAAEFTVVPRRRPLFDAPTAHPFTVRVQSAERETQNLTGEVTSGGLIPVWLVFAALILTLVGIICLAAYAVFQPGTPVVTATQTAVAFLTPTAGAPLPTVAPPTEEPTALPTETPTETPTATALPTGVPSPTPLPTETPTATPVPTLEPTATILPTEVPTTIPTETPTEVPTPTATVSPIENQGRLAFESNRDGNSEIYVMNTANWAMSRLTIDPAVDTQPVWSPDGSRIAFTSNRTGDSEIYLINADGTALTNLTRDPASDQFPAWSPDGEWIAFATNRDGNQEIYIMRVDGSELRNLTNHPAEDYQPTWFAEENLFSTDERFAFTTNRDGNQEVYAMKPDGSEQINLTNHPGNDFYPVWSPDGRQLTFTTNRDGNQEIYAMQADGTRPVNLTNSLSEDTVSVWSPDGRWIAFTTNRDGNQEIYVMRSPGAADAGVSGPVNVTNHPAEDRFPAWIAP